jgi:hypothetical protein
MTFGFNESFVHVNKWQQRVVKRKLCVAIGLKDDALLVTNARFCISWFMTKYLCVHSSVKHVLMGTHAFIVMNSMLESKFEILHLRIQQSKT